VSVFVQKRLSRMFWMLGDQGLHTPCVPALWLTSALPNGGLECSRLAVVGEPSERGNAILKICNATCNAQPPALELSHQTTSCPGCTSSTLVQSIDPIRWSCRPRRTACSVMPQHRWSGTTSSRRAGVMVPAARLVPNLLVLLIAFSISQFLVHKLASQIFLAYI